MRQKPAILVVNGEQAGRAVLARDIAALGYKVRSTDDLSAALKLVSKGEFALTVLDIDLFDAEQNGFDVLQKIVRTCPKCPVIALGGENTVLSSLLASRFGAIDFFARPYSFASMAMSINSALAEPIKTQAIAANASIGPLIAHSEAMQSVLKSITNAAKSHLPVVISGAIGTGKFLTASLVHKYSKSNNQQIHCLFPSSELNQLAKIGAGETVVLRRLNLFDQDKQHQLCDWLDENQQSSLPIRLIVTTAQQSINNPKQQNIVPELYNRINVLQISLPTLTERRADITDLAKQFLSTASAQQKTLNEDAAKFLQSLPFKGNVRELKNLMLRVANNYTLSVIGKPQIEQLLRSQQTEVMDADIADLVHSLLSNSTVAGRGKGNIYETIMQKVEKPLLQIILSRVNNNQIKAAEILGINRNTLAKKIRLHCLLKKK